MKDQWAEGAGELGKHMRTDGGVYAPWLKVRTTRHSSEGRKKRLFRFFFLFRYVFGGGRRPKTRSLIILSFLFLFRCVSGGRRRPPKTRFLCPSLRNDPPVFFSKGSRKDSRCLLRLTRRFLFPHLPGLLQVYCSYLATRGLRLEAATSAFPSWETLTSTRQLRNVSPFPDKLRCMCPRVGVAEPLAPSAPSTSAPSPQ